MTRDSYLSWVNVVHTLELQKARIERLIEREAASQLASRRTLPGTTVDHLANGMKAKDDRLKDLDTRIDRATARAMMYGMGMIAELLFATESEE